MQKHIEEKKITLEQTHLSDDGICSLQKFLMQACCKKSKCCEKYKRKGKHCKKCPKK